MIPRRLIRTVPEQINEEQEAYWEIARSLHPSWEHVTFRDPIDPARFPLTAPHWDRCTSGAQLAGLIRLEALWFMGGVYVDSDYESYRSFTPLMGAQAFVGWESPWCIIDAVIGAEPGHPAIMLAMRNAVERLPEGASRSGPLALHDACVGRDDVLALPPGCFYPYYWTEREREHDDHRTANPWGFGAHKWRNSWGG